MTLESTQPLVKMSTRNISGGKGGRCVRLTTSPPSCAECHEIWEPKTPGTLWATLGLLRDSFTFVVPTYDCPIYNDSRYCDRLCLSHNTTGCMPGTQNCRSFKQVCKKSTLVVLVPICLLKLLYNV
jgi:hypothetical protein